jgi:hypothetical protein
MYTSYGWFFDRLIGCFSFGGDSMYDYKLTQRVLEDLKNTPPGIHAKTYVYLDVLKIKGPMTGLPYKDKIEGYKNLFELRPSFHNIEFRVVFYWQGNVAKCIHTFYEKGKKKKNQREYATADRLRKTLTQGTL